MVITTNRIDSKVYPNGSIESYGYIREVGTGYLYFNGEKSHTDLNIVWEDGDDMHDIYLYGLDEVDVQLFIYSSDPGIAKKIRKENGIDLPSTLNNNESVINNKKRKNIVDDKKEDKSRYYLNETTVIHSSHLTNIGNKKATNDWSERK